MGEQKASLSSSRGTAVVCGSTGYLGRHVVGALHADGWRVRALVRDADRLGEAREACDEIFVGEATRPETLEGLFDGADAAFSSIGVRNVKRRPTFREVDQGANLSLVEQAERAGVGRFVFISVLRGDQLRDRSPLIDAREHVVDRLRRSSMSSTVLRPTGFFNDMVTFFEMARRGRVWLIGRDTTRINPIHGADLAAVAAEAMAAAEMDDRGLGGPDVLTQREIAELCFAALGTTPKVSHVPSRLVRGAGHVVGPVNANAGGILRMFAMMGEEDMIGDPVGTHRLSDFYRGRAGSPERA